MIISDRKKRLAGTTPAFEAVIETAQDYYPFGSLMPGRKYNAGEYRFGFNGQEKDDEIAGVTGSHTTALFWEYDTRLGRRWNVDPVVKQWESPYLCFSGNPIWFSDPNGDDVDPTTAEAKTEIDKYTTATRTNKKGKTKTNNDYQHAFAEQYEKWENDKSIVMKFTTTSDAKEGGSIEFNGTNDAGQNVYTIFWDQSQTKRLGTSALFEETAHMMDALKGEDLAFDKPGNGTPGLDIYDEVRAKKWVISNIKGIQNEIPVGEGNYEFTHYGYIKLKLKTDEEIAKTLQTDAIFLMQHRKTQQDNSYGGQIPAGYTIPNFGGGYKTMSSTPLYPPKKAE
jgi:RHS repeat-associated protein